MREPIEKRLRRSQRECLRLRKTVAKIRSDFAREKKEVHYSNWRKVLELEEQVVELEEEISIRKTHPDDASEYRIYMQDRLDARDVMVNRFHFSHHPWVNALANVKAGQGTVEDRFVLQESY